MNILPLNWIKFFHNAQFPIETMQKLYEYITRLSPNTMLTVEEVSQNIKITNEMAVNMINSLMDSKLLSLNFLCPECNEKIAFTDKKIIVCTNCSAEVNAFELPMAIINKEASLVYLIKDKINDISYETNARLIDKIGKERGYLYYLLTDIKDSQIIQENNPDMYSLSLFQLWSDFWPEVMHISRKSSLQLYSKGDAVAWVFNDKEDLLKTIFALAHYLYENPITKISIYASKIILPPNIKITFMRSLDNKWDLNTPSVTDFYRKTDVKLSIWEKTTNYVLKYCLFDCLADDALNNSSKFFTNGEISDYFVKDKHNNIFKGKCFAGFCNSENINSTQEPPHA